MFKNCIANSDFCRFNNKFYTIFISNSGTYAVLGFKVQCNIYVL